MALLPMSKHDRKMGYKILNDGRALPEIKRQVSIMLHEGKKAELQALCQGADGDNTVIRAKIASISIS